MRLFRSKILEIYSVWGCLDLSPFFGELCTRGGSGGSVLEKWRSGVGIARLIGHSLVAHAAGN
jgi:hypothetical protein